MKRTFNINITFQFELDDEDRCSAEIRDGVWGYGQYKYPPSVLDVWHEIRTCIAGEFARDEAGLTHFPENVDLRVEEV